MKQIPLLIIVFQLITSCSSGENHGIELYNGFTFELKEGEKLSGLDQFTRDTYSQNFNNAPELQVPLFKYIKNNNYDIFLGIPYNSTMEELSNLRIRADSSRINTGSDRKTFFCNYESNGKFISEYATVKDNETFIYVGAITDSKAISDSLFSETKIAERIK